MKLAPRRMIIAAGLAAAAVASVLAVRPISGLTVSEASALATEGFETSRPDRFHEARLARTDALSTALPGGASSLKEYYQDWQVACSTRSDRKICAMSQQQADPKARRRVLAVEFTTAAAGKLRGTLVLPFGLALDTGVSIKVDDSNHGESLRFRTCLPVGCIVTFDLGDQFVRSLRSGTILNILATPSEDSQPVAFSVSLSGFAAALDRLNALGR
ncbi:MAG TPA: invasion associated locus B family protein [Rhizobiaceae bacterium]|nr:invasion associated locus B family protein [Rhizobiaceae bacterium]